MHVSHLRVLARTLRGIEWVASAEVRAILRPTEIRKAHRELRFSVPELTPDLLTLGTVDDLFLVAATVDGVGRRRDSLERVAAAAEAIDLEQLVAALTTVRTLDFGRTFDVVGSFVGKRNYSRYDIEDTFGAALAAASGWSYCSRSSGMRASGSLSLRVHLADCRATIAARIAPAPLHRRAYRLVSRPGSLHPPLARALVLLAGLRTGRTLVDPFCGAGTIPIEAKLASRDLHVAGFDLDPVAIAAARQNAARARLDAKFTVADAAALPVPPRSVDRFATNPPWGSAVSPAGSVGSDAGSLPAELLRVLAPAARVAILVPPFGRLDGVVRAALNVLIEQRVRVSGALVSLLVLEPRGAGQEPIDGLGLYGRELAEESGLSTATGTQRSPNGLAFYARPAL
jgi:tRNA (guanine6-N2)-methyltransferase